MISHLHDDNSHLSDFHQITFDDMPIHIWWLAVTYLMITTTYMVLTITYMMITKTCIMISRKVHGDYRGMHDKPCHIWWEAVTHMMTWWLPSHMWWLPPPMWSSPSQYDNHRHNVTIAITSHTCSYRSWWVRVVEVRMIGIVVLKSYFDNNIYRGEETQEYSYMLCIYGL